MTDLSLRYVSGSVQNGVLVVTITAAQLRDPTLAFALRDEIISLLNGSNATVVVLDARNVQFIGSVGFLAFLGVRRHLAEGRIIICNMSDSIREMFAICRLITSDASKTAPFEAATTLESALACCAV